MYEIFVDNLKKTLAEAGYIKINMPADLPFPMIVDLWGRETESIVYFYITYDTNNLNWETFPNLKVFMEQNLAIILSRIQNRHCVAFNIFVGEIGYEAQGYINSTKEFSFMEQYDIFIGVNENLNIINHPKAPMGTDKCLAKLKLTMQRMTMAENARTMIMEEFGDAQASAAPRQREKPKTILPVGYHQAYVAPAAARPYFAYTILGINIFMLILLELTGGSQNTLNLLRFGAAQYFLIFEHLEIYRLFVPMFLHIGIMHLASNSMWIAVAGTKAERLFGHGKFVFIYLASGFVGNVAMVLSSPMAVGAGASGSVYGIFGALLAYMLKTKRTVENFNVSLLVTLIVVGLLMGFAAPGMLGGGANTLVSNSAHIGGLVAGIGLGWVLTKR